MQYLEENNIIHRDLASRNLLLSIVDSIHTAQVCDFGLSGKIEGIYLELGKEDKFPVRWSVNSFYI